MEENINYHMHIHPLRPIQEEEVLNLESRCVGCEKSLSSGGPIYGCSECKFYRHKACTELPKEIQSFFHPCPLFLTMGRYICNACFQEGSGFGYHCKSCPFWMHVECAQRPNIQSNGEEDSEEIIQHFTHWHPLRLIDDNLKKDLQVGCRICEKSISFDSASSAAYGCEECNFFLHKSCMINIPQQINNHLFHRSCPAPLIQLTTPQSYTCRSCYNKDISGLVFHCRKCNFFQLDVKCALLPTLHQSKDADKIQHFAHHHPLVRVLGNKIGNEIRCILCTEIWSSELEPCFGCERCRIFIHRQCATEFKPEIFDYFHILHTLTIGSYPFENNTFPCGACLGAINICQMAYSCAACNFYLHADCVKPKAETSTRQLRLKCEAHPHYLTYFNQTRAPTVCNICGKLVRNCLFRCVPCSFDMHLYCHPSAPKTITHKCHIHPLTLTKSPFEFELISPQYLEDGDEYDDEFYCDVCEEKRFKNESVYYCAECKFIAETRCVLSELLPSVEEHCTGDARVVSLEEENSAIEASIADLDNRIAALRAEKDPLISTIERAQAIIQQREFRVKSIERELEILTRDRTLGRYQLFYNLKKIKNSTEASTSKGN
ncbi:Zinc finger, PHD-type [Corchorus olitorius]|uniref:Zinc finger, PHD-type n=1 Tax=Corchorus olitorius TaxID=93759 RepID=A0A1R3G3B4_9ROSI|nr:Zinc finger, PHD-type [Corchorus olitorius]